MLRFSALGGSCELYAVGTAQPLADTAEWILSMHRHLTRFDPRSELSRLNALAGQWVDVSPTLHELLEEALVAYETSGGLVHAGVLPALVAAGYDRTFEEIRARERPGIAHEVRGSARDPCRSAMDRCGPRHDHHETSPSAQPPCETSDFLKVVPSAAPHGPVPPLPDLLHLRLGAARLRPGAAIDLGGIAKGWIADRAVERMGPNALANCAGDLMARGAGPHGDATEADDAGRGRGWPVRFADRTLLLADMAAATSGTTKRRWGPRSHHIIDPRTGFPAASDLAEVSVLARSALDAEILAKAALLLGSVEAPAYLEGRVLGWALLGEDRPIVTTAEGEELPYELAPVEERLPA